MQVCPAPTLSPSPSTLAGDALVLFPALPSCSTNGSCSSQWGRIRVRWQWPDQCQSTGDTWKHSELKEEGKVIRYHWEIQRSPSFVLPKKEKIPHYSVTGRFITSEGNYTHFLSWFLPFEVWKIKSLTGLSYLLTLILPLPFQSLREAGSTRGTLEWESKVELAPRGTALPVPPKKSLAKFPHQRQTMAALFVMFPNGKEWTPLHFAWLELLIQYIHCHLATLFNQPPKLVPKQEISFIGTYCSVKTQGQEL